MFHPILSSRKVTYYYLALWLFAGVLPWPLFFYFYDGGGVWLLPIITDALVSNLLYCGMALNFWYVVRYINLETSTPINILVNHLVLAAVSTTLWVYVTTIIMKFASQQWDGYYDFLLQTVPARFVMGLILYSVIILLYYTIFFYHNLQQKQREEVQLQSLVKEAELNILKSQINPHFIFNSLNSISSLTITRPEKAREMIIKLSEFMRYALDQDLKQKTKLKNEIENIKRYLEIEKIRFGERLTFALNIDEECYECALPNMILQPLLENAIKHGVHESTEPISIELTCKKDQELLMVALSNNFDPEIRSGKSSGIGLSNIRQRLQLIYEKGDLFKVTNIGSTFNVSITFPQEKS